MFLLGLFHCIISVCVNILVNGSRVGLKSLELEIVNLISEVIWAGVGCVIFR